MKMFNKINKSIVVILIFAIISTLATLNVSAFFYTTATSNGSSIVYDLPNSGSMQIGSIGVESVKVYWQESGYYYIEYTVSGGGYGGYKRGYVPTSKINVSGIVSRLYPSWNSHTTSNKTVYDRPDTNSYVIGTVYGTDSIMVLDNDSSWYYIQYPISGGYKRGYVHNTTVFLPYTISSSPVQKFTTDKYQLTYNYTKIGTTSYYWDNWIATGIGSLNSSLACIYVTYTTSSSANIKFYSGNYGATGWDGLCEAPQDAHPNLGIIKLNDYTHSGNEAELVTHETGHTFKLNDYTASFHTVMRESGYNGNYKPTDPDIIGINVTY